MDSKYSLKASPLEKRLFDSSSFKWKTKIFQEILPSYSEKS